MAPATATTDTTPMATTPATTYRLWARVKPESPTSHQPRWFLQGGPVGGWSIEDAAAAAIRWQNLHSHVEVAILPLMGSSPCTMQELARVAGL
jgi:hypothetical protein